METQNTNLRKIKNALIIKLNYLKLKIRGISSFFAVVPFETIDTKDQLAIYVTYAKLAQLLHY